MSPEDLKRERRLGHLVLAGLVALLLAYGLLVLKGCQEPPDDRPPQTNGP